MQMIAMLCTLLSPALMLTDHGHFQYNTLTLALTLWAIIAIMHGIMMCMEFL